MAMNPWAGARWADILERVHSTLAPEGRTYFVTVFDQDFDTAVGELACTRPYDRLAGQLERIQRIARNRFRGVDFFLQLDLAFQRLPRESRTLACFHWHGLAWGKPTQIASALAKFPIGFGGADGGRKKEVYDLAGALRYIAKDTRCRYVTVPAKRGQDGSTFHHREPLFGPQRLVQLSLFRDWAKPELCIGSGLGANLLARAKKLAQREGFVAYDGNRPEVEGFDRAGLNGPYSY